MFSFRLKENVHMNRQNLAVLMLASGLVGLTASAGAQQSTQQPSTQQNDAYQGVSQPPQDTIEASPDAPPPPVIAKPSPSVYATPTVQPTPTPRPSSYGPVNGPVNSGMTAGSSVDGTDAGIVRPPVSYTTPQSAPPLAARPMMPDPDGDIVRPRAARPGELLEGSTIRVKLMDRLSSVESERGQQFRGQVALDVLQDGKVMIPAGSGIEGRVTAVSAGHFGGHGSLRLQPETVILPDGTRYQLHAETTGTRGSKTKVGGEGRITPGSRAKKDGIEYGAVMGTGAVTGAVLGGPVGALTGTIVGAGVVTTHLMVDHPQATLEPGSILLFTLTEPMNLTPAGS
jgi:hypothetical protein